MEEKLLSGIPRLQDFIDHPNLVEQEKYYENLYQRRH
jgi:hypothetical protein